MYNNGNLWEREKNARYKMLTQSRILIVDYDAKIHWCKFDKRFSVIKERNNLEAVHVMYQIYERVRSRRSKTDDKILYL